MSHTPSPRRILWPTTTHLAPTILGRLGRILHWLSIVVALGWIAFLAGIAADSKGSGPDVGIVLLLVFLPAAGLCLAGRAARYVLSDE